LPLMRP